MGGNFGDLTGQTFGTCTLIKPLGQGGMGAVYLARQTRPSRNVAVKILNSNHVFDDQLYHEFLARFQREADVIARLEHVNIMPIYEYGEQNNIPYLVMPYLTGGSLRDMLAKYEAIPLATATTYIEQAAAALDYAHAHGVIHRDLKPANFLLHGDGRLVLADFGIARIIDNSDSGLLALTHTGTIVGTPDYMAPEMAQGDPLDYRVDIYELGIVLYQMLTGHVPFTGSSPYAIVIQHIQKKLPLIHVSNPNIPPAVDAVLQKATAKQPAERFTTVRDMALALREAVQHSSSQSQTVADEQQTQRTSLPINTASPELPQTDYQARQQQPVAPPIIADQAPIKLSANTHIPGLHENSVSTLADEQPRPTANQFTPQKSANAKRKGVWIVLIVVLLAVLIGGGILVPSLLHNSTLQNKVNTPGSTSTVQPTTTTPPPLAAISPAIAAGSQLYGTPEPFADCDKQGGHWTNTSDAHVTCGTGGSHIINTSGHLVVGNLDRLAGSQSSWPSQSFIVQVQVTINANSQGVFGINFRSQTGDNFAYLLGPSGNWSFSHYNAQGSLQDTLVSGRLLSSISTKLTIDIRVEGTDYTFYVNGVDTTGRAATGSQFINKIAGLAVDTNANVTFSNFALYAL